MTLAGLLVAGGCDFDGWAPVELTEPVGFCLDSGESIPNLIPDPAEPLTLSVMLGPKCFSSSCSRLVDAGCEYSVDGNRIELDGSVVIEERVTGGFCTDDCRTYSAECELDGLAPGEYEVYGAGSTELLGSFKWSESGDVGGCSMLEG